MVLVVKQSTCQCRRCWRCGFSPLDPLEKELATQSSVLTWRIPWTEETGRLRSLRSQSQTRLTTHAHKTLRDYLSVLLSLLSLLRVPLSSLSFLKHVKSPPQQISTHYALFLKALVYPRTPGSSCGSFLIPFRSLVKCHLL